MGVFVAVGLLNPLSEAFGLSASGAGLILTIYALAYAVGSPVLVSLTGGLARRTVMATGMGLFAFSAIAVVLSPTAEWLFAARILTALGAGLFTPITASVAAAAVPPERQGRALAAVFAGLTVAQVLGVPAGSWIGYTFGWQAAFLIVAVLSGLCCVAVLWAVPRDLPFSVINLGTLGRAIQDWRGLLVILFTTSFLGSIYVIYTYLAPLLTEHMGYGRDGITIMFVLFGVGAVIGNLFGGWVADRIGPFRTLLLLTGGQILTMPFFAFFPMGDIAFSALLILWAVLGWSFVAGQQIRVVRVSAAPTVGLALNAAAIYLGAATGSSIGAMVLDRFDTLALGWAGAAVAVLALAHLVVSQTLTRERGRG
ncbi:Purine efflux pump PbuE [Pontivivens insulae]|uniref:Purine efflux pump PbuE n=2 Tax=Pontivivens insulae TaxID=1639689 RepID=A0A2R8A7Y2_9RHOB|nr:putative MFS family arabinose efflux permease [Pontivivens insulae]SPF28130.1 Purine efflux pump PbuE [Pontivivens insulae]